MLVGVGPCGIALYLYLVGVYRTRGAALRYAAFNVVSVATTTGYANTDYNAWPIFAPLWMLFPCSFVSCSGSTGSGMKMVRAQILFKQIFRELAAHHPPAAAASGEAARRSRSSNRHRARGARVRVRVRRRASSSPTLLLAATGLDALTAFFGRSGIDQQHRPGLGGQVGPMSTYAVLSDFQIVGVARSSMLLGPARAR